MSSEIRSETAFAPLPVKPRTTLEVLDISVKLYRRYFGVLTLWSLVFALSYLVNAVAGVASFLAMPLVYGAACCALAAAVRGQRITFNQVWEFTKPRYGALLGMILLATLILIVVAVALSIGGAVLVALFVAVADSLPESLTIVSGIFGIVLFLALISIFSVIAFGWLNMVPVVVCMEEDKRGVAALGRAWSLMSGHWKRVGLIAVLVGLSVMIFFGILGGFMALFFGFGNLFSSDPDITALLAFIAGATFISALFAVFWTPAQTLIVAVLYLDLRVRKEALDLEWSSYKTQPQTLAPPPMSPAASPTSLNVPPSSLNTPTTLPDMPSMSLNEAPTSLSNEANPPKESLKPIEVPPTSFGSPSTFGPSSFSAQPDEPKREENA